MKVLKKEFTEIDTASEPAAQQKLKELTGDCTVPKLLCNDKLVGDYEDCWDLIEEELFEKTLNEMMSQ